MELAFPILFPYGRYGFTEKRDQELSITEFLLHCNFWHDRRFATHPLFLFWVLNRK